MRARSAARLAIGVALPGTASGCVCGEWSLSAVEPSAVRRDFRYDVLTLEQDGSFYAETRQPEPKTTSGTYRMEQGMLSLSEHDGRHYTCNAEVSGNMLKLKQPWKDRERVASFERKQ